MSLIAATTPTATTGDRFPSERQLDIDSLDFTKGGGQVVVVTQDATTGSVLMVAHADREALERTRATGEMHYTSRRRGLWHKGATSGDRQQVVGLSSDCDGDAILARVVPLGPACHTGNISCFSNSPVADALSVLDRRIAERAATADGSPAISESYTVRLLSDRNVRLKKLGEELAEFVVACADENSDQAVEEAADLVYHILVALRATGASLDQVRTALANRGNLNPTR